MKRESGVLPTIKRVFVAGATMSLVLGTTVATAAQPVLATWTPAVTIATPAGAQELNDPGVAVSSDGQQQSVVWIRKAPSDNRIQYATSADRGATWAAPMDVDSSSEVLSHPSVVTSQDGQHTTVAYVGNVGSMHETRIRQLHGSAWGEVTKLSADGVDVDGYPLLTMNSSGSRVLVTWSEASGALKAAVVDDGVAVTRSISPSVDDLEYAYAPVISADGTTLAVVWSSGSGSILARTSTDGGVTWGTAKTLVTTASEQLQKLAASISADGSRIVATWQQDNSIKAAYTSDKGQTWSVPATLGQQSGFSVGQITGSDSGTRFAVAWTNSNARGNSAVQVARTGDGGVTWSRAEASPVDVDANIPLLAASSDGRRLTVTWVQQDGTALAFVAANSADAGDSWSVPTTVEPALGEYGSTTSAASGDPTLVFQTATGSLAAASATLTTVPGPPQAVTSNGATISWSPPVEDGGAPVVDYTVSAGSSTCSTSGLSCALTLSPGTYAVTVAARNVIGNGLASAPITVTIPAPPTPTPKTQTAKKPPSKLKKGKKAKLAPKTSAGAKITWKSLTTKKCVVKKGKVVAKNKGKCKLSAKAPAVTGYSAWNKRYVVRVR